MDHRPADALRVPPNHNTRTTLLTPGQVLEILLEVIPHAPPESQKSFIAMFGTHLPGLHSRGPPKAPPLILQPPLLPDSLHSFVRAKTTQHLFESDWEFEAKQRAAALRSRPAKSKGITKRYEKPSKNRAAFSPSEPHTTPYGVPWSNGGTTTPGDSQAFDTPVGSANRYHWIPSEPLPHACPPA